MPIVAGRVIVAELWSGSQVVRRLAAADPSPTVAELDAIATALTPASDGVRPTVRVLEVAGLPGRSMGSPGSPPPSPWPASPGVAGSSVRR